jgi:hypothetical protein
MSMMFNSYSVKGSLKFFKNDDDGDKITLSIGINANHKVDMNIYDKLNDFLEKLLIKDYHSEEIHNAKIDHEKQEAQAEKERVKYLKVQEKEKKASMKPSSSGKKVKKAKSLY